MHIQIVLQSLFAQSGQNGVRSRGNCDVGGDHGHVADVDVGVIHEGEVEVGVHLFPEVYIFPCPVCIEGRLNEAAFADLCEHFLHELFHARLIAESEGVVLFEQTCAGGLFAQDFFVCGVVDHFFFHAFFSFYPKVQIFAIVSGRFSKSSSRINAFTVT